MVDVARGFLSGLQAGQLQKQRGLNIEAMRKRMAAEKRKEEKEQQISGLLTRQVTGDREAERGLIGLGREGVQAATLGRGYLAGVREEEQAQVTAQQEAAGRQVVEAVPYAMNVRDEREWRQNAFPYLADAYIRSGGRPELVQQIDRLPMAEAQRVIGQMFNEALPKQTTRAPNVKTYQSKSEPGKTYTLDVNNPEDLAFIRENQQDLIPAPTRQEAGAPGAFGPTKKEISGLRESEIATKQAIATSNDLLDKIEKNPDLLQSATSLAQVASGLGSEIRTAARVAGVDIPEEVTDIAAYEDTFDELGIENKVAKGLAFDLALAYAAASGLGSGRALTDRDIRLAMERIGAGGLDTPAARKAAIQGVQRVLDRNFRIRHETIAGTPYEGDLGVRTEDVGQRDFNAMTIEDLQGLNFGELTPEELDAAEQRWNELDAAN